MRLVTMALTVVLTAIPAWAQQSRKDRPNSR